MPITVVDLLPATTDRGSARGYVARVEVTVTALRAGLAGWIDRAQAGEDVVITQRGRTVARLVSIDPPSLARLVTEGVVDPPRQVEAQPRGGLA